jgi:hypothetical protein
MLTLLLCFLRGLALFRPRLDVSPGGKPYLIRWYLTPMGDWYRKRWPGIFLHCFLDSDPDRGYHSHPWVWAWSLILRGCYREFRPSPVKSGTGYSQVYVQGNVNRLTGNDWHRVKLLSDVTWTLFVVGPLHGNEWGFMSEDGTIRPHGTDTPGD